MRLLLLMLLLACSPLRAGEKITLAAFEFPPIYQNASTKGLSGDIVVAAFKAVDIDVELKFFPVARMIRAVAEGEVLGAIGGKVLFEEPEVDGRVSFSEVVQYVSQVFIYDTRRYPQGVSFKTLDDVAAYRIGVLDKSGIHRILEKHGGLRLEVNRVHEGLARQLQAGRVDLWATVDLTGLMHLQALFPSEYSHFRYTRPYNKGDVTMVFSKARDADGAYAAKFRKGLDLLRRNGDYEAIMARYYGGRESINRDSLAGIR